MHAAFSTDRLEEQQRLGDLVTREGVDDQLLLVGGRDFLRRSIIVEDTVVEESRGVDERHLEMQTRFRDLTARFPETHDHDLFGFTNGEGAAGGDDQADHENAEEDKAGAVHQFDPP